MRLCSVEGCGRKHSAQSLCGMHYQRTRRGGVPGENSFRRVPNGDGHVDPKGYRVIVVAGRRMLEHRHVMELALGRPLLSTETVHHINGVRRDNRPENLELWSTSQPYGQRVADKVAWAIELLRQYSPASLSETMNKEQCA